MKNIRVQYGAGGKTLVIPSNSLIIEHHAFLRRLFLLVKKEKFAQAKKVLAQASDSEIESLVEASRNVLKGSYPGTGLRKKLLPYKRWIRKIADEEKSIQEKRKSLQRQRGGLLPLAPLLAPIVSSIVGSLIGAAI
jgi:hypothetical protein